MALTFDGATQYGKNANAPVTAVPLTMACWVRGGTLLSSVPVFSIDDGAAAASLDCFAITASNATMRARSIVAGSAADALMGSGLTVDTWTHLCAVFTSATSRAIFKDGTNKTTNATNSTPSGLAQVVIGSQGDLSAFFTGDIAEAAIWNVALADAEVSILGAGAASPLMIRPASLVAYWPLIGRNSPAICPKGGFNLTLTGAPVAAPHCRIRYPKAPGFDRSYLP